jgi:hypothetical protein
MYLRFVETYCVCGRLDAGEIRTESNSRFVSDDQNSSVKLISKRQGIARMTRRRAERGRVESDFGHGPVPYILYAMNHDAKAT